jgi:hypothetical protein
MTAAALFIPLNGEHFDAFERGEKHTEYRIYGSRWNERTCPPGRPVTLSRGYGTRRRLHGKVQRFHIETIGAVPESFRICYPNADPETARVACIVVELDRFPGADIDAPHRTSNSGA